MPGKQGYAVVSCHVERPLDDRVWNLYLDFVAAAPAGFRVASLLRPPAEGEPGAERFAERARAAAAHGPVGHHTHFTSPTHARPTGGDPAAQVRREGGWLREQGVEATFYCGGGWYADLDVIGAVADLGYADCTATSWRPVTLAEGAARLELDQPAWLVLPDGRRLLELPTTHSAGAAVRSLARPLPHVVHLHVHDYELLDRRRAVALRGALRLLALRRRPASLADLEAGREVAWADVWRG